MTEPSSIEEIFFKFLMQYEFDEKNLDYTLIPKHIISLQTLSDIGNSGISVFDFHKKQTLFYSANFGKLLGYVPADYSELGHQFFDSKIHPDDKLRLALNGISMDFIIISSTIQLRKTKLRL